jgi:hypothetical protein
MQADWSQVSEPPRVSGWRWVLYWMDFGQPHLLRYVNGDSIPPKATHWQFVDEPLPQNGADK